MLTTPARGAISRRGIYRESFQVRSPGGAPIDPAALVFKVRLWPESLGRGCCHDWGWSPCPHGLSAETGDPARITAMANDAGVIVTWSFPVAETERLAPGSYRGSLTARSAADPADQSEIATFTRVVLA